MQILFFPFFAQPYYQVMIRAYVSFVKSIFQNENRNKITKIKYFLFHIIQPNHPKMPFSLNLHHGAHY